LSPNAKITGGSTDRQAFIADPTAVATLGDTFHPHGLLGALAAAFQVQNRARRTFAGAYLFLKKGQRM
jgi:hypothetical protein